jgi:hypothetical protein
VMAVGVIGSKSRRYLSTYVYLLPTASYAQ